MANQEQRLTSIGIDSNNSTTALRSTETATSNRNQQHSSCSNFRCKLPLAYCTPRSAIWSLFFLLAELGVRMVPTDWSKVNASGWPKVEISSYVSTSRYEERRPTEVKLQSEDGKTWYSPVETFRQADGSRMYITEDKQYVLSVHVLVADGSQNQHELQMGKSDLRKVMPRILSFSTDTSGDVHWSILCYQTVRHDLQTWVDSIMQLEISEANAQLVTQVVSGELDIGGPDFQCLQT